MQIDMFSDRTTLRDETLEEAAACAEATGENWLLRDAREKELAVMVAKSCANAIRALGSLEMRERR